MCHRIEVLGSLQPGERPAYLQPPHSRSENRIIELGSEKRTERCIDQRRARIRERLRDPTRTAAHADLEDRDASGKGRESVCPGRERERAEAVAFCEEERPTRMMEHARLGVSSDVPAPFGAVDRELGHGRNRLTLATAVIDRAA